MKPAVCLLSGGLDSSTCLAWAQRAGFACYALSFDYGQRHRQELAAAQRVARELGAAQHLTVPINLRLFGGSALTADLDVPKHRTAEEIGPGVPITYVPARNTIFLALALGWAETLGAADIVIGVNAIDYSGYPDCRPEFIRAFETLANLATRAGAEQHRHLTVHTPLAHLDKAGITRLAYELGLDPQWTHTCYDPAPDGAACGACDACLLRRKGFAEAGRIDPVRYR